MYRPIYIYIYILVLITLAVEAPKEKGRKRSCHLGFLCNKPKLQDRSSPKHCGSCINLILLDFILELSLLMNYLLQCIYIYIYK